MKELMLFKTIRTQRKQKGRFVDMELMNMLTPTFSHMRLYACGVYAYNIAIHLTSGETIYADELSFEELYGYSRVRQLIPCNYPVIEKSHDGTPAVVNARFLAVTADGSVRSVGDVRTPIDLRDPEIFNSKAGYSDAALK